MVSLDIHHTSLRTNGWELISEKIFRSAERVEA
jgi:hypothetical protein